MKREPMLPEIHRAQNMGWLRAAVLGANDGLISTASLIVGVAAANSSHQNILITGVAGIVAGALSMAAGEYVSVSTQADTEKADLAREREELAMNVDFERAELAQIYVQRGLDSELATKVAQQLMDHDAIGSHARDELGITEIFTARPIQAAVASAAAFSIGAVMPLLSVLVSGQKNLIISVTVSSLIFLIILGVFAAHIGGANLLKGAVRMVFWGALAMSITAGIGSFFGTSL